MLGVLAMLAIQGPGELKLWYQQPAAAWTEALPVGNGRLGAMVFGGVAEERLQLNEDTIWAGPPVPEQPVDASRYVNEARALFFAGKPAEGEALVRGKVMATRISPRSYQTLGDLKLAFHYPGVANVAALQLGEWRRGPVGGQRRSFGSRTIDRGVPHGVRAFRGAGGRSHRLGFVARR